MKAKAMKAKAAMKAMKSIPVATDSSFDGAPP